jgi:hypothetical protein
MRVRYWHLAVISFGDEKWLLSAAKQTCTVRLRPQQMIGGRYIFGLD